MVASGLNVTTPHIFVGQQKKLWFSKKFVPAGRTKAQNNLANLLLAFLNPFQDIPDQSLKV